MFKVISDMIEYSDVMWNTITLVMNVLNLISWQKDFCIDVNHKHHYGIKCLRNLLQLEPCNDMFKVISDIMAHWYDIWKIQLLLYLFLAFNSSMQRNYWCIDDYHKQWLRN